MSNLFVIILNWNQPKLTIECIKSLAKCRIPKEYKIYNVVVDNGSSDDSVSLFRKLGGNLKILETGKNLGFAGGNNVGIKYALENGADYILILNNDIEVQSGLIANLLMAIEKSEDIGIVSPKMYFAKGYEFHKKYKKSGLGKVIWYAGGVIDWKNVYGTNRGVDEIDKGQYNKSVDIDFATGACMMVNAKALKEVGLFNEKYYLYMEDVELSQRMKAKNWKILYGPKAVLWHKVSQSSGIGSDLNDYFITRNRLMFGFKYAALKTKLALMRESLRLFVFGRHWQAVGVRDFYIRRVGRGSWGN
jgi:GT2 family glycosyltransferase